MREEVDAYHQASQPQTAHRPGIKQTSESAPTTKVAGALGASRVRALLRNKQSLRTGIILAEVLGPPASLRSDRL